MIKRKRREAEPPSYRAFVSIESFIAVKMRYIPTQTTQVASQYTQAGSMQPSVSLATAFKSVRMYMQEIGWYRHIS